MATELVSVFEERAENLSEDELNTWTVLSSMEQQIVGKLTGPGAKLISGPRGSGKSTLLKIAYYQLLANRSALPLYVNFSRALAIEPLFHRNANANQLFRQWVLAKILSSIRDTFVRLDISLPAQCVAPIEASHRYIVALEAGDEPDAQDWRQAPSEVSVLLRTAASAAGVNRTVLLLDDAAHAFSVRQQREFFEVFRELRSRDISAKAAIYPGVTSFSPSFQIGHEAEEIKAWIRADASSFLPSMRQIASKRFPDLKSQLGANYDESVDVLALASFGLPRGFVNMISEVVDALELGIPVRKAVLEAISSNADAVLVQFRNIADKLPRFTNYVEVGKQLESSARAAFREFNCDKDLSSKTAILGLAEPWDPELDRVLRFMEYSGLARRIEDLSKGVKGIYQRYVFHYSRLIATNSLFLGKNYKISAVTDALRKPSAHALVKTKPDTILGAGYANSCTLALPACPQCSTARVSENQKFCMQCGHELRSASIYLELLIAPIEKLPLPVRKIEALRNSGIYSVGQLLSDENHRFRKPGSSIGPVWASKIINIAEEFVSV